MMAKIAMIMNQSKLTDVTSVKQNKEKGMIKIICHYVYVSLKNLLHILILFVLINSFVAFCFMQKPMPIVISTVMRKLK